MRKLPFPLLLMITALMLAALACKASSQVASSDRETQPPAAAVEKDVTYCTPDGVELKMDIYYPASGAPPWPAIVYVHGGGWVSGDKSTGAGAAEITRAGFLVAAINYRLAPDYKFPAQIEDVKCAVRFLRAHAAEYNLDPAHIGAWGSSAGGHLASLLGTADESAGWEVGEYLDQSSRVQAVVDMFGPSDLAAEDFITMRRERKAEILFGISDLNAPVVAQASPINHVSVDDPPFLIVHGTEDKVVPASQSQSFYEALVSAGVPVQLVMVENAGHGLKPATQSAPLSPSRDEVASLIVRFFTETLMGTAGDKSP